MDRGQGEERTNRELSIRAVSRETSRSALSGSRAYQGRRDPRDANQDLSAIGRDPPVARLVGLGERRAGHAVPELAIRKETDPLGEDGAVRIHAPLSACGRFLSSGAPPFQIAATHWDPRLGLNSYLLPYGRWLTPMGVP